MAQRCQVCAHAQRGQIDAALRSGAAVRALEREWKIPRTSIAWHRDQHLVRAVQDVPGVPSVGPAEPPAPDVEGAPPKQPSGEAPLPPDMEELLQSAGQQPAPPPSLAAKKDAFLEHYAASGDLRAALRQAHINRVTLRKWQEHDESFALRFNLADAEAVENLESEARIRAVSGSKMVRRVYRGGYLYEEIHEYRPSDAMLVKLLQAARPEKYGDKLTVTQTTVVKAIDAEAWSAV